MTARPATSAAYVPDQARCTGAGLRIVRLANFVTPESGGLRTALRAWAPATAPRATNRSWSSPAPPCATRPPTRAA
ncbi:hypothetical protein SRIMM317S_00916 [Streptomyces rimosus subsp. rimosus]